MFRESCRVANRTLVVHAYDAWGDLRFEGYDSVTGGLFSLVITFLAMVRGLTADGEFIALAQLLCAVAICTYPPQLMHAFVNRLDLVLPGEDRGCSERKPWTSADGSHLLRPERRWWRKSLVHERPRLIYHEQLASTFRGPVYKDNNVEVEKR